jgi:hypothetical protein
MANPSSFCLSMGCGSPPKPTACEENSLIASATIFLATPYESASGSPKQVVAYSSGATVEIRTVKYVSQKKKDSNERGHGRHREMLEPLCVLRALGG